MADAVDMGLIQMIRYSMRISLRTSKWYMLFLKCLFPPVYWVYINYNFQASTISISFACREIKIRINHLAAKKDYMALINK